MQTHVLEKLYSITVSFFITHQVQPAMCTQVLHTLALNTPLGMKIYVHAVHHAVFFIIIQNFIEPPF